MKTFNEKKKEKDDNISHTVSEVICVKCFHRYICVRPSAVWLKDLECETCGKGFIIETGQPTDN